MFFFYFSSFRSFDAYLVLLSEIRIALNFCLSLLHARYERSLFFLSFGGGGVYFRFFFQIESLRREKKNGNEEKHKFLAFRARRFSRKLDDLYGRPSSQFIVVNI